MKLFRANIYPLLLLGIPLVLTGILESGVYFFETLFLARLGPNELAAGGLVSWLFGTFIVVLFGLLSSINILVAQKYGEKDQESIALIFRDGLRLAFLFFIPAFLLFWNIPKLFLLLGQSPLIVALAEPYLHALVWGLLPDLVMIALMEFLIGLGHTRVIFTFSLMAVPLTVFFSFVLIFGKFGFPKLGIAGAGWGTVISYWISGVFLTAFVFMNKEYRTYTRGLFKLTHHSYLFELIKIGAPMGAMYCIEIGFFFIFTLLMGTLGNSLLAANQIAMQYMWILMSMIFSIAQAITVRMGHLLGAHEVASAERAAYAGICIAFIIMLIAAIFYWFLPILLISIDFDIKVPMNKDITTLAVNFLFICAIFQLIECVRITLFGALRGLRDTHFTLIISIISFWGISLPLGYYLTSYVGLGGAGLWWGLIVGVTCSIPVLFWRFKYKIKAH